MYIVGIIKTNLPKVLISPKLMRNTQELFDWLLLFFNKDAFKLSEPVSLEKLTAALEQNKPIRINVEGYPIAILLGAVDVIENATERYVHIMDIDLLTATAEEVRQYILSLES